jgi:hypothetical protein
MPVLFVKFHHVRHAFEFATFIVLAAIHVFVPLMSDEVYT